MDDLEFRRHGLADALHFHEALGLGAQHFGEGAEAGEQVLGDRLGVATADGAEQHHLEQLVVRHGIGAALAEAVLQAVAMAEEMRRRGLGAGIVKPRHDHTA